MEINSKDLVVGTRYWLDGCKDESGIFQGYDTNFNNTGLFSDFGGDRFRYIISSDGFARIDISWGIYSVD